MKIDYSLLQYMKECYALLYVYYLYQPGLLRDFTTKCLYDALMAVKTDEDLEKWLKAIAKTDLSLSDDYDPMENAVCTNFLGLYERSLRRLTTQERSLLVGEIGRMREEGLCKFLNRNLPILMAEALTEHRSEPGSIVILYDKADHLMAVGEDADRLYRIFGWQTAAVEANGVRTSMMPVSRDILRLGLFPYRMKETTVNLLDILVNDPAEVLLSAAQQTIDAFRRNLSDLEKEVVFQIENVSLYAREEDIETVHAYPFLEVSGDRVSLFSLDARRVTLVTGQSWNVTREMADMLAAVAEYLHLLLHDRKMWTQAVGLAGVTGSEVQAMAAYAEYKERRQESEKRLLLDYGGMSVAYDDDAVSLACEFHLPLWTRGCGFSGDRSMVMLSPEVAAYVTAQCADVRVLKARVSDSMENLRVRPSELNGYLDLDGVFTEGSLFLKKDGGYAVRAKLYGSMLPMRDISKETGCRYMRMPEGLDKRIFLNSILYKTYLDGAAAEINGKAGRP